jgi:hypothetical protein
MYHVEEKDGASLIIEQGTDQTVFVCGCADSARSLCRSMNLGSGFNGFTPHFFTIGYREGVAEGYP